MPSDTLSKNLNIAIQTLKAKEGSFKKIEAISNLGSWEIDLITKKSLWSDQTYKIYGEKKGAIEPNLELFFSHVIPEDIQRAKETLALALQSGNVTTFECTIRKSNGEKANILMSGQAIFDHTGLPIKLLGTIQDITQQVSLRAHSNELAQLIEYSSNEIYIVNYHTLQYLYVNKGGCDALGYTKKEFLKLTVFDTNPTLTQKKVDTLKAALSKKGNALNFTIHQRKNGSRYHAQAYIHTLTYHGVDAYVIFDTDISDQKEVEELLKEQTKKLTHQAHHDTLTGLPNRTLFKDRLAQTIIASNRSGEKFALLFIDLDHFKKINDSLGHHVGDEVLIESSKRLQKALRAEDTLARLGGDEFTVILKDIKNIQGASTATQKIIDSIKKPIKVAKHTLYVSSSVGISFFPDDATNGHDLIKFADTAMYKAKDEGRDSFQFYSSEMTTLAFERVVMENSIRVAINDMQFVVYYQPQIHAINETLTGMEALVRWKHPTLGIIPPGNFISIAEESGLIMDIDHIVMHQAMYQFSQWYKEGLNPGILSLNLSMKQLEKKDFVKKLLDTMYIFDFQPEWLELEVTEGQVMSNPSASIQKLNEISNAGIEIAIDDFGTGYSSLAYLKKLPLDKLKIDQSFIKDIPHDEEDASITKAIIALGKSLNLKLVAEGVETKEQKGFLIENGCFHIQGYFYSRPIPADEIARLLKKSNEI